MVGLVVVCELFQADRKWVTAGKVNIINLKGAGREGRASSPGLRPSSLLGEEVSKDRPAIVCVCVCVCVCVRAFDFCD